MADAAIMSNFSSRVFELARSLEVLRHALAVDDPELAILAGAQLRTAVVQLELAYEHLPAGDRAEARLLLTHVRRRADDALAAAPSQLPGVQAIHAFLARFG